MCGKFTQRSSWNEVVALAEALAASPDAIQTATPMAFARIIRLDADGRRENVEMRWGFPDLGHGAPDRPRHIHARAETIDTLATFADSFARRRGILLAETFNEGEETGAKSKKQWVITPKDGKPIAMAVIWQDFTRRDGLTLPMFAQATVPANALITPITDRMPAILREEDWATWLGETDAPLAEVKALLRTYEDNGAWSMAQQASTKKAPAQDDLFS